MALPTVSPSTTFAQLQAGGVLKVVADTIAANSLPESTAVIARAITTQSTQAAANYALSFVQGDPIATSAPVLTSIDEALNALAASSLALTAVRALIVANPGTLRAVANSGGTFPLTKRFFP
jgi:hypothetical protein